jgi:hypothetical protein
MHGREEEWIRSYKEITWKTYAWMGLSVEALRMLHRGFSTSTSALSQRSGPYGRYAPFVTALL